MKAVIYAKARHLRTRKNDFFRPSSCLCAERVAAHGEYIRTKTHNATASACPITVDRPPGHITEREETIVSFAKKPDKSADAIRQSPMPRGESRGAISPPASAIRLSDAFSVTRRRPSREQSRCTATLQSRTTVPARDMNARSLCFIAVVRFFKVGRRYFGSSTVSGGAARPFLDFEYISALMYAVRIPRR